ncbi:PREDICTED: protein ROOT PRIMORDIUM DEFECTIVE 1 [Ipomoea nil]|uniref:protein ROOT PRIMORDIUM DEFECTIVE 1 n=1 Tax=Ipomoea nil TaxID=35883 RepID=UPI0009011A61|nr:PREDICTED: protein ROOT PRIMORDIUM DEFECTIVE 1 [Ipomoea nil]
MHFISRSLPNSVRRCHHQQRRRTLYDGASSIRCVRDRGLDHAVERERSLKQVWNIKNLIKSEPSISLPLNLITQSKDSLQIPTRPIEFLRKYPAIFQEFFPGSVNIHPHIKLTPEALTLDSEEQLLHDSVSYRENVADRLLKLLMIGKTNKIPLSVLDRLKWDLGLPQDYAKMIVPEFPDYFRVSNGGDAAMLELVCWSHDLAVSEMEKKGESEGFCLSYSNGFEMDKKHKKWVDEWQKLPYLSPYNNPIHLSSKSDESDKWVVGILHEVLSLCIGKKAEKENVLVLGEYLGLRSRFKRAFLQHPGIFYVSSKIGTHTLVLKEAYKRGALLGRCSMMEMRFKYIRLMNKVTEDEKSSHDKKEKKPEKFDCEDENGEEDEDEDGDFNSDYDDEEEERSEDKKEKNGGKSSFNTKFKENPSRRLAQRNSTRNTKGSSPISSRRNGRHRDIREGKEANNGGRTNFNTKFEGKKPLRAMPMKLNGRQNRERSSTEIL